MSKRAPSTTQLLVIAGFALLVLRDPALPLDHLRRADPVQGEAVRDQDPVQRGDPAGPAVRRADLRRLGRQSADRSTSPPTASRRWRRSTSTTSTRRSRRTRGRSCGPRRCSARPTSNSPPAAAQNGRSSRTAAPCRRPTSPNRSSSTRSSAPSIPAPAPPSRNGCRKLGDRDRGPGPEPLRRLRPVRPDLHRIRPALPRARHASGSRSGSCSATAPPRFSALRGREGQLADLIQNSNAVFQTTAARDQDIEALFRAFPTFLDEFRTDPRPAQASSRSTPTR